MPMNGWTVDGLVVVRTVLADLTALNDEANAAVIVAAVNALPALIAVARAAEAVDAARCSCHGELGQSGDSLLLDALLAALDRINEEGAG